MRGSRLELRGSEGHRHSTIEFEMPFFCLTGTVCSVNVVRAWKIGVLGPARYCGLIIPRSLAGNLVYINRTYGLNTECVVDNY